ncbi:unnamed protein product [Caenorhabditis nigoni]
MTMNKRSTPGGQIAPTEKDIETVLDGMPVLVFELYADYSTTVFDVLSRHPSMNTILEAVKHEPKGIKERFKPICNNYIETQKFKDGDKKYAGYKFCCDALNFCPVIENSQMWIYIVCGVVGLLLLVGIAGAVFFLFYRKRKKMGK